jgi:G patch domain-containing protein 1
MNYLSAKDRERLQRVKAESAAGLAGPAAVRPPSPEPFAALEVPFLDRVTANAALRGYMPFADNPAKQERYRSYLSAQANPAEAQPLTAPPGQGVEASNAELREFNKSAGIFRPMSVAMSSRFTSSSSAPSGVPATDAPIVAGGLYQPTPKPPTERADLRKPAPEPEETEILSDAQQAARSGMFGALTRSTSSWAPEKLLCKRFGVPPPSSTLHDASAGTSASSGVNAHWEANRHELEQMAKGRAWTSGAADPVAPTALPTAFGAAPASAGPTAHASGSGQSEPAKAAARSLETVGLGEDENQGRETLTYVRPPIDIFKAVFASDDEEDGDEAPVRPLAAKAAAPAAPRSAAAPQQPAVDIAPRAGPDASDPSNAFRPAFVPRAKRTAVGAGSGSDEDSKAGKQGADAKREKKRKKDKDKRPKGMLTFSVDDE